MQQVNQYPLDTVNSPIPGYENPPESGVITEDGVEVPAHIDDMEEEWLRLMVSAVMEEQVGPEQSSEDTAITEHDLLS